MASESSPPAGPSNPATPRRRPTIREVARRAGVSHQTVSRHLKGDTTVNEQLAATIQDAIEALDYRPNLVARAMRNHRTGRLAVLLPPGSAISSLEILSGAKEIADAGEYVLEVVTVSGSAEMRDRRALELRDSRLFEGVLALTSLSDLPQPDDARVPLVTMPLYDEAMRGIGALASAGPEHEIISRLAGMGHRRFLHLAGNYAHAGAVRRRDMYLQTIEELGLESAGVVDCGWDGDAARRAVVDLPADSGITAIIAANDILATAAVSGAIRRGWNVPEELSITGWDDTRVAAVTTPSMTTVAVHHAELGRRLMRHLLDVVASRRRGADDASDPSPSPLEDDWRLAEVIWRESTGPAPQTPPAR